MQNVPRVVFTKEFKEEAVKMVIDGGLSQPEVCRRLSLGHSTLARWVRQAKTGVTPVARRNPVTEEEMGISRLKREVAELRMEWDILKNATVYFAKESLKGTRS
jgi:transposase